MANYNRFGAVYTDVVSKYNGASTSDFGDQAAIESIMDSIETEMVSKMNGNLRLRLKSVWGMLICKAATEDQTVIDVPTTSGVTFTSASDIEVWAGETHTLTSGLIPVKATGYTSGDGITIEDNSDAIRITLDTALEENEVVIMSCDIDPTDSGYSIETLKQILLNGAAALAGGQIYTHEDATPMSAYNKKYERSLKDLNNAWYGISLVNEFVERLEIITWDICSDVLVGKIIR